MKTGYLQHDIYQQPHDKQNQNLPHTDIVQCAVRVSTVGVKNPYASTLRIKSFLIVAQPGASLKVTSITPRWYSSSASPTTQASSNGRSGAAAGVDVSKKM